MSKPFDPYHKWLGIRPEEQPPHHYRLLGISLFESDPDVIDSAADQRTAHVRSFQNGPHSAESQKLLSEIAVARRCLLNAAERSDYDHKLRAAQAPPPSPKPLPVAPLPVARPLAAPSAAPAIAVAPVPAPSVPLVTTPRAPRRKSGSSVLLLAAGGGVFAVAGAILIAAVLSSGGGDDVAQAPVTPTPVPAPPVAPSDHPASTVDPPHDSSMPSAAAVDASPSETVEPSPGPPQSAAPVEPSSDDNPPAPVPSTDTRPPAPAPRPAASPPIDYAALFAPPADARLALPDAEAKKAADRQIEEVFSADLKAARTPPQKQALATQLLDTARGTANQPVLRFAMLEKAHGLAAAIGDCDTALEAIELQAADFQVGRAAESTATLVAMHKRTRLPALQLRLAQHALEAAQMAVEAEQFDVAEEAAEMGVTAAAKGGDGELSKQLRQLTADAKALQPRRRRAEEAAQALAANGDDSEAKGTLGEYLCLYRNDWSRGLPLLAESPEGPLRELARLDLQAPTASADQLALANRWWDAAQQRAGIDQERMQRRAGHWYEQALPSLTGVTREQVAKRVLASRPSTRIDFKTPQSLRAFVLAEGRGRKWLVDRGFLRIEGSHGATTYARYYKSISSVLIRGGIESTQGRNFRVSVGPLNMILNWEGANENHYRLGEGLPQSVATRPHALTPGKIEEILVRQDGENVVVEVSGRREFSAPGKLEGTVSVYPAGSPILVQEIVIEGDADPAQKVTGPSHKNLY